MEHGFRTIPSRLRDWLLVSSTQMPDPEISLPYPKINDIHSD
jgi:hypothetical protein